MISYYHAVREVARHSGEAIDHSVDALRDRKVEQEPAMTDRMLGAIEESLSDFTSRDIRWRAKTLTDRGRGAQETTYGAYFLGVLNIDLPDFTVAKGFLAQAKLLRRSTIYDHEQSREQEGWAK
ncbi:MAG: hypothetical protein PHR35_04800 [Kiritimatiellae bacterium]|nr:hypothetical protein [Kiritimatiellia bacterium]